jgi:chromosomal replication initiation ATPase DnaA
MQDIFDEVESVLGKQPTLARNVKMFLCQKCTGEKLKDIGIHFGIGESGVSQGSRRVADKIKKDKKLKRKIVKIERKLNLLRMKT